MRGIVVSCWKVVDSSLVYDDGSCTSIPDASTVFRALGYEDDGSLLSNPAAALPKIRFSKNGATFSVRAEMSSDGFIEISPVITRRGRSFAGDRLCVPIPEHCVIDNNWLYFSEGRDEANRALEALSISSFGRITLAQYCQLVRMSDDHSGPKINTDLMATISEHEDRKSVV